MAALVVEGDRYRSLLHGEEEKNTKWRFGTLPNYNTVNKLFEEGRTKVWPAGSLEEKVQNLAKSWEMEMIHKTRIEDFKTIDTNKFTFSLNGRKAQTIEEISKLDGGYGLNWQTSLPKELRVYNPIDDETAASYMKTFSTTFPRGFAMEVLQVYSGPPVIAYKFRHWGFMDGPFRGHAATGEMVELFGMAMFEVDEDMKIVKVEFFYDRGELLAGLLKGAKIDGSYSSKEAAAPLSCPVLRNN
ncbi:pathogen-related protein-like [Pistacia vera]|uniref:Uncharacterized protein n=1 Tax=Pistacia integerrima TaxID=434235 RepID=A0ACC0XXI1_9ROSI|nr:pathogen-related protein-like [Pistacia vera]KAJ0025322.1 hypothetical protein Pint_07980 [Pistacia integerrima]